MAENLDRLVRQYSKSSKAVSQEAAVKREIAAAKQSLSRAEMLYDSLFQNYADKLMSEQEYTEMKRQYRTDMERAQSRLNELEQRQSVYRLRKRPVSGGPLAAPFPQVVLPILLPVSV